MLHVSVREIIDSVDDLTPDVIQVIFETIAKRNFNLLKFAYAMGTMTVPGRKLAQDVVDILENTAHESRVLNRLQNAVVYVMDPKQETGFNDIAARAYVKGIANAIGISF